jgi:hypothetical protein
MNLTQCTKVRSAGQEQPDGWKGEEGSEGHTEKVRSRQHETATHDQNLTGEDEDEEGRGPVDEQRKDGRELDHRRSASDHFNPLRRYTSATQEIEPSIYYKPVDMVLCRTPRCCYRNRRRQSGHSTVEGRDPPE